MKTPKVRLQYAKCVGTKEEVLELKAEVVKFVQAFRGDTKPVKAPVVTDIIYELFDLHEDEPQLIVKDLITSLRKELSLLDGPKEGYPTLPSFY